MLSAALEDVVVFVFVVFSFAVLEDEAFEVFSEAAFFVDDFELLDLPVLEDDFLELLEDLLLPDFLLLDEEPLLFLTRSIAACLLASEAASLVFSPLPLPPPAASFAAWPARCPSACPFHHWNRTAPRRRSSRRRG